MSDRPYQTWGRTEWTIVGTLAVVVVVYVGASVATLANVSAAEPVGDAASGLLWLTMSAWLLVVYSGLDDRWRLVGAGGFVVAGVTEFALLAVDSGTLEGLNLAGLLLATAILLVDVFGYG